MMELGTVSTKPSDGRKSEIFGFRSAWRPLAGAQDRRTFLKHLATGVCGMTVLSALGKALTADSGTAEKMPVLFAGHGNPMNALEDNAFSRAWKDVAQGLPRPRAILCISAHWETNRSEEHTSELQSRQYLVCR